MLALHAMPARAVTPGAPAPVAQTIAAARLPAGSVSFAILDVDSGRLVAGQNVDTPRSPASTIKVVTTYASLDLLGPAYVWHTRAAVRGDVRNGVLEGDLVLQGGGDPYMTLERWWSFVRAVRDAGITVIHGDIVVDDTAFSLPAEDPAAFDGRPNRSYNVVPDALMVNFQTVGVQGGAQRERASGRYRDVARAGQSHGRESHFPGVRPLYGRGQPGDLRCRVRTLGPRCILRRLESDLRAARVFARAVAARRLRLRHVRGAVARNGRGVRRRAAHRTDARRCAHRAEFRLADSRRDHPAHQ